MRSIRLRWLPLSWVVRHERALEAHVDGDVPHPQVARPPRPPEVVHDALLLRVEVTGVLASEFHTPRGVDTPTRHGGVVIVDPPKGVRVKYGLPAGPLHVVSVWTMWDGVKIGVWLAEHPAGVPGRRYTVSDGRTREEVTGWEVPS